MLHTDFEAVVVDTVVVVMDTEVGVLDTEVRMVRKDLAVAGRMGTREKAHSLGQATL